VGSLAADTLRLGRVSGVAAIGFQGVTLRRSNVNCF
jgi:hypothetical protein